MPRYARITYPGGIYHVVSRFFNREFLVRDDASRNYYLGLLKESLSKTDTLLLAWCIMSNHIHLVLRSGNNPLARLMKPAHSGFAIWLNHHLGGRKGSVFASRYKSILIEEEAYLFELIRYVHNNPVRAGLVERAGQSSWSSHRCYTGQEEAPSWLNIGYVLGMFDKNAENATKMFAQFVDAGRSEGRRRDLNGEESTKAAKRFQSEFGDGWRISGPIVGSDKFAARVLEDVAAVDGQTTKFAEAVRVPDSHERPSLDELIATACVVVGVEPWEFEQRPKQSACALVKKAVTWLWVQRYQGRQIEVARSLDASTAAVSRWYGRAVSQIGDLEPLCDAIATQLTDKEAGRAEDPRRQMINM